MNSNWLANLIPQLWSIPYYLVFLIGIVLSLVYWRRHPIVSLLCLVAFSIMILNLLLGVAIHAWVVHANQGGPSSMDIGTVLSVLSLVRSFVTSLAWILLLVAMFGWRTVPGEKKPSPFRQERQPDLP